MSTDTASMEFRSQRLRLQDQMLALLPHFSTPDTMVRQLNARLQAPGAATEADIDEAAQILGLYQEVAANLTAYCRNLIASIGNGSKERCLCGFFSLNFRSKDEGPVTDGGDK